MLGSRAAWAGATPVGEQSGSGLTLTEVDLRLVVDSIPHIVWVAGRTGVTEYVNRWTVEYAGGPLPTDGTDIDWASVIHPDDLSASSLAWRKAYRQEIPFQMDYRLRGADGAYRWHRFRALPLRGADGNLVKWLGTATDIEERKRLEEGLRRSERAAAEALGLLEAMLATAPIGIGFAGHDLRFRHINRTLSAMAAGTPEQHLGRTVAEVVPALWPQVEPMFRAVLEDGEAVVGQEVSGVTPATGPNGGSWLVTFYPVRVDGDIIGAGVAVIDITHRVEADEFRSVVLDNMVEGLCTVDPDGVVTSANRAACRLLGVQAGELVGTHLHSAVTFTRNGAAAEDLLSLSEAATDGADQGLRYAHLTRRDGTVLPIAYSVAPLRFGGTTGGTVVVFRDVTAQQERQQREIETRHDQKLESLGRLSAGIAHEINTPIQFVGDNTRFLASAYQEMLELLLVYRECLGDNGTHIPWQERLERTTQAESSAGVDYLAEEVPAAVAQSLEGIERVASLVRAMKAFSYKDGHDRSYANLNDALATTLTVARNEVKYVADVRLDFGDLPDVLCHIGDLNQVFLNLLVNAADAMQGRGERGEIRITTRAEGPTAVISIADDGCGIPEEIQQVIFEPFFTTKEVGKGTGQGLALARAVVCDKHGGTIDLRSAPGEGTEFVLRLPIDGKRAEAQS